MRPRDTSPEAWRVFIDRHRKMSLQEKFNYTLEQCDIARSFCEAGIRRQYPNASDREVFLRLTQRTLGKELFRKVYGDVLAQG